MSESYDIKICKNHIYFNKQSYLINLDRKAFISLKEFNISKQSSDVIFINIDLDNLAYVNELYIVYDNDSIPMNTTINISLIGQSKLLGKLYIDCQSENIKTNVNIYNLVDINEIVIINRKDTTSSVIISSFTNTKCSLVNYINHCRFYTTNYLSLFDISALRFFSSNVDKANHLYHNSTSIVFENCQIDYVYNVSKTCKITTSNSKIENIYNLSPYKCKVLGDLENVDYMLFCTLPKDSIQRVVQTHNDISLSDLIPFLI